MLVSINVHMLVVTVGACGEKGYLISDIKRILTNNDNTLTITYRVNVEKKENLADFIKYASDLILAESYEEVNLDIYKVNDYETSNLETTYNIVKLKEYKLR